jgi:hypothetical protein
MRKFQIHVYKQHSNGSTAPSGSRRPHCRGFAIRLSWTRHTLYDSSGRVISPTQRPLLDNTQHSQQTDIHAGGGIRIHNPSKRATADPRLRPRGHWDQLTNNISTSKLYRHMNGRLNSANDCCRSVSNRFFCTARIQYIKI